MVSISSVDVEVDLSDVWRMPPRNQLKIQDLLRMPPRNQLKKRTDLPRMPPRNQLKIKDLLDVQATLKGL